MVDDTITSEALSRYIQASSSSRFLGLPPDLHDILYERLLLIRNGEMDGKAPSEFNRRDAPILRDALTEKLACHVKQVNLQARREYLKFAFTKGKVIGLCVADDCSQLVLSSNPSRSSNGRSDPVRGCGPATLMHIIWSTKTSDSLNQMPVPRSGIFTV
ncbi:hypothetical protein MPH_06061 [Macrophomina phaseolina MS6]|uniref:Uncharacterized protein n=1 Tax=Macrophomina phaseolina (strain MS6) TaxID=1126212 RepID=K2SIQ7_MACPH|nr:hypothetical protein MPH_06061 [Macrophomina phaseolina MS6]